MKSLAALLSPAAVAQQLQQFTLQFKQDPASTESKDVAVLFETESKDVGANFATGQIPEMWLLSFQLYNSFMLRRWNSILGQILFSSNNYPESSICNS